MFEFSKCENCIKEFDLELYEVEFNPFGREKYNQPQAWQKWFLCFDCFMEFGNHKQYSIKKFKKWGLETKNF